MPKKKKNGQSAVAGQCGEHVSAQYNSGTAAVSRDLSGPAMSDLSLQSKDEIVKSMHDMFSHLDPDVIYIVLSEADFKVDNAMDALLELSGAAEGKTTTSSSLSGFEMAAALLEPHPSHTKPFTIRPANSETSNYEEAHQFSPKTTHPAEELDSLIDQELESLTMGQPSLSFTSPTILPQTSQSVPLSSGAPSSPLLVEEALLNLDQLDVEPNPKLGSLSEQSSKIGAAQRKASPINELSLGGAPLPQESGISVDFSHLTHDPTSRPSAFKAYRTPDQFSKQTPAPITHPQSLNTMWNLQASEFKPFMDTPTFITPLVQAPYPWAPNPTPLSHWMTSRPPLKPSATVPKSWILSSQSGLKLTGQVLVLLRGAPGSGKTTLARSMLEQNPGGIVLSTDEYFTQSGSYHYEPHLLGEAHAWNHRRAKEAFENGIAPIIIDNTNLQCWEMKPYVALAQKHKYKVLFREPNTWWKSKPRELERRTKHGVTKEKIRRMLENQDCYVTVQTIMCSQPKPTAVYGVDVCQPNPTEQPFTNRPDLVGDSGFHKPGSYLSSSLPDVSSVECSSGSHGSTEYMSCQKNVEELPDPPEAELLDGADLDQELDAFMAVSGLNECNVSEDVGLMEGKTSEPPVMFGESIGQRVKRTREHCRTAFRDTSTLNCDFSDSVRKTSQDNSVDENNGDAVSSNKEELEFVGDWPSETLEQRTQRSRKSASQTVQNPNQELPYFKEDTSNSHAPNHHEFQKLLKLLQGDNNHITQETTQDVQPSLATEAQPVLPDCVLDWKSERSSDPEQCSSHTPSPITELHESPISKNEVCTDVHTPANSVKGLDPGSEQKDKPNCSALSSGGEVEYSSESSKERRKVPSRRSGKYCKLALTFTHQSPLSCPNAGSPVTSLQPSELNPSPEILFTCPSAFAQTEPQDFALLWRIDQQKCSDPESGNSNRGIVILKGNASHFVPEVSKSSEQQVIPYRVCHEKGSQVEENDLRELPVKLHSLEILSRHFKHVAKETLEDLYEKCNQDMEWTTNVLLDSGEHLYRGDEEDVFDLKDAEGCDLVRSDKEHSSDCQVAEKLLEPQVNYTSETAMEETGCVNPGVTTPNTTSSNQLNVKVEPEDSNDQIMTPLEHQPEPPDKRSSKTLQCMPGASSVTPPSEPSGQNKALNDSLKPELESEVSQIEVLDMYLTEGLKDRLEEEDTEVKEQINAIILSQKIAEMEHERKEREKEKSQRKNRSMNIQTLELKLSTELALQLTELFGPVGVSPDEFFPENCSVLMDLNLAKLLHQKWKETIQEKHRQETLSYHLLQESSVHYGESQPGVTGLRDSAAHLLIGTGDYSSLSNQSGGQEDFPFMDHWNISRHPVSLRDIMLEEQVLQDSLEKSRLSRWDQDKKDGAAIVKEKQLFALFPTIDRHFLRDIFRDYNYSLEQTEQFLHTLLDNEPVRTVVASESETKEKCRAPSKERKQKNEIDSAQFQDIEDPEYVDFRTEATLQRHRQQECLDKAAKAYRQGCKDVASFYAQQGHLHGQKMKEANHRAAMQIFERVNSTLLPQNVLDLHGLHVNEALHHLQQVLADKTSEWQQGLCRPQLSVITGRGNHSQGGVARIRPAVLDYLRNQHYKFTEPKLGLVIVMLH
ncbi:NEDD4-binding protein 2 isoform X1 [Silurus asotus]|uniref:NEDD4-binding protein 2 isoform X1 n=1 Tax=Silurus asotus TaxID=30991 RepID=A0AAD5A017_SILAS|nr:NEDD4-binding protein 2 isoform X1 [Silurus asotus]